MSLIINQKTLNGVALVTIKNTNINVSSTTKGDLTIIKSGDEIVGLNIQNFKKYFDAKKGVHIINQDQISAIEKLGCKNLDFESKFIVGEVLERKEHPKSKKLFVLKVKTNTELKIVTNSLNSIVGAKVVVATVDATLPSGLPIVLSKVMGIESQGMLCGGETLGLEKTDGILIPKGRVGNKFIF